LFLVGALMVGWITVQLVDRPAGLTFLHRSDLSLEVGAWLGLFGALLIAAAGALSSVRGPRAAGD
jgi:hypothetical protein